MAQFNAPSFNPQKKKNPDDEYIKVFDKLRNFLTNPEKANKAKDALIGLVLRHSDIADRLADVVNDPEKMEEVMTKYPYLTGYTGKNLAERAREVTNKEGMLNKINDLQTRYATKPPEPVSPTMPAPTQEPAMPMAAMPEQRMPMTPASTPSRTAPLPVNPASGQLIK